MNRHRFRLLLVLTAGLLLTAGAVLAGTTRTIRGTAGADTIRGTPGPDTIYGLGGNDKIYGGAGNDKIYGGAGNDHLYGGAGNDLIVAGAGADVISCGPGNDTAVGDSSDKAAADCEHTRGIPRPGGGGTSTPKPACSNGKDDDGDGKIDYPNDPGCDSPSDTDETDPTPPPPTIQAGTYCGFTEQGPGLCVTTDGHTVTGFQTSAIVDCQPDSRWTWTVTFSGQGVPIQSDNSFSYSYDGPLDSSSTDFSNIQENEFIKGVFTSDGKATGTLALSTFSFDNQGTHYACTQNPVSWHVAKQ